MYFDKFSSPIFLNFLALVLITSIGNCGIPDAAVDSFGEKVKTCKEALKNIPKWSKHQELTKHDERVVRRLKKTKEGQNVWDLGNDEDGLQDVKKARMSHIYKRLDSSKPSYTVTGSGGGGTHVYHFKEDSALTNRERARLQTFPDKYEFEGGKESIRRQIGMAVPVEGAKKIINQCITFIENF